MNQTTDHKRGFNRGFLIASLAWATLFGLAVWQIVQLLIEMGRL